MPDEPSDTTVGATTEPAPEPTGGEQSTQTRVAGKTSLAALFKAAEEEGHTIGVGEQPKEADETTSTTDGEPESTEDDETPPEGADLKPAATAQETEPPKGLSISEQVAWYKDKGEKPPWFLERISEQSATLAKRTERLEKAEQRAKDLEAELAKRNGPQPTRDEPFKDVFDEPKLKEYEGIYRGILKTAIENPDGAEGVYLGEKNPDGTPKLVDLDADGMRHLKSSAQIALDVDIPARRRFLETFNKRKTEYAAECEKAKTEVFEKYPEFKNAEDPFTKEAATLLQQNPKLEQVLGSQTLIWLARALKGKALESNGANGNGTNDAINRITTSARTRIAPSTTKTRSMPERKGADVASARKQLETEGTEDAALAYVNAVLSPKRGTTAKQIA